MENQNESQTEESNRHVSNVASSSEAVETKTKKRGGCLFWGVALFISIILMTGCIMIFVLAVSIFAVADGEGALSPFSPENARIKENYVSGDSSASQKIAVIEIRGVITDSESTWGSSGIANSSLICMQLDKAAKDDNVKAIILKLDTPGGEVTAADTIYHNICELRKNTGKPVISSMGSVAASGGVYIAVASDYIIANKLTTTGSIGVIAQAYNYSELFKKIGLQAEVYKSGPMKDLLNGARPRTQAEVEIIDQFIQEVYTQFVHNVAVGRPKLSEEQIRTTAIGDGRFYSGKLALEYGLIDELGYFEDAVDKAASLASIRNYQVVSYQQTITLADILMGVKSGNPELKVQLPGGSSSVELPKSGKFFLLPAQW